MNHFLSKKSLNAIKELQKKLNRKCIENEKHFRIHLLWNIYQNSNELIYDPQFFNTLLRQYPCDCIQHRIKSFYQLMNNHIIECSSEKNLHEFSETNQLLEKSKRLDLLHLYNFISSGFITFQELTNQFDLPVDQYINWCRKVSTKNFQLHQQLVNEIINYEQIKIHRLPPREIPPELIRSAEIINDQVTIALENQRKIVSRCMLDSTRNFGEKMTQKIPHRISKSVNSHIPNSSSNYISSEQIRLEHALLVQQANQMNFDEIDDLNTLRHDSHEVEDKYNKLLERKFELLSLIEKKKNKCQFLSKSAAAKSIQYNLNNSKLESYKSIIDKNKAQLDQITIENNEIQESIDRITSIRRSKKLSKMMK